MATPGFLDDRIDFEQLVKHYKANGCRLVITGNELQLARRIMRHVIDSTVGDRYNSDFARTEDGRFQIIFNSTMEEMEAEEAGLCKRSSAIWSVNGQYEGGTDFLSTNGKKVEAKVYRDMDSALKAAKKGSVDYTVFHGAEYVLCYLINSYELDKEKNKREHWFWLKKVNGVYSLCEDKNLRTVTERCLPATIPVCYCKLKEDHMIIDKNTYCY